MHDRELMEVPADELESGESALGLCAMLALFACATASLMLTLYTGRHNQSITLVTLFVLWVLAPFAGLYVANSVARRRPARNRAALHLATLMIAISSAVIYGVEALYPPRHGMAFMFLLAPAVSWVVIGVDTAIALRNK